MHRRRETIQPKKTTTGNIHLLKRSQRSTSLRRTWSNCLPSLASNTVKMVVATLQIGDNIIDFNGDKSGINDQEGQYDDEYDDLLNIGQKVQVHIPNIVLDNFNLLIDHQGNLTIPNERKYNNSTLLFLDVSGFTSLTEQYSNDAHLGVDQLTRTLNSYFDKLVDEILTHEGDLYKFAGDAILALWTNEITGPEQALKCALNLQQKCGAYKTDVGVILRLKVALAYGSSRALFVGTDEFKHYLLYGDCVKDVNICEQLCEAGDILITKAVHEKLQSISFNCEFVPLHDEIDSKHEFIAVKYSQSSRSSFNEYHHDEDHIDNSTLINDRMDLTNQEITIGVNNDEQTSAHNCSYLEFSNEIDSLMKSFLLPCVYKRIDRKQSLYYLSELRRVTISFINLHISNEQTIDSHLAEGIHRIFSHIYELTKTMGGMLTKALLFDKGWSFLCVFGLPGYKQGDDTANALKAAQMIHSTIRTQSQFVEKCSIGVTTGLTYCGVVGHRERCEYTVIGRKVNMAARLMCNYPDIISCDQETYYNSRLNTRFFRKLPDKALKGMNNVGIIWQYSEDHHLLQINEQVKTTSNSQSNDIRHEDYPLLGRRVELMIVAAQILLLDEPVNSSNKRRDLAAIIFEGEDKIGRSRLLRFIADSLENSNNASHISSCSHYNNTYIPNDLNIYENNTDNETKMISSFSNYTNDCTINKRPSIQVIVHRCLFEQRFNEFGLLRSLLKQLLQFHRNDISQHEREQYLLRLFDLNKLNGLHLRRNLFLLNDLLDTRFRRNLNETDDNNEENLVKTCETNINELILHILNKLIEPVNHIETTYQQVSMENSMNKSNILYGHSHISSGSNSSLNSPSNIVTFSKIIFIIDDIHFADESSLKHLLTLGSHHQSLLILSLKPIRNNNTDQSNMNILQSISTDSRVYRRRLPGLELHYLATLACQILSVHKIPAKLVKVFNESCNGIPGFCEQILYDLRNKEKIYTVDVNQSHNQDSSLIEGESEKLLLNSTNRHGLFKAFFCRRKHTITIEQRQNEPAFSRICLIRNPDDSDFDVDCQQNFQNYIMCRIDRLSEGETLLIKIAAVIGNTFSRMFLWHLVDPHARQSININSCVLDMMQRTIIECAFNRQPSITTRSIKCYCLQNLAGFPSRCRLMAFAHSTIREGIYNSLTDGLKRLLTRNAIDYLEKQCTILCLPCGVSQNESPFLVHEQDGLGEMIKNRQHRAFVDIVKIAALKEIDNTIKELAQLSSSPVRLRSSPLSKTFSESIPIVDKRTTDHHLNELKKSPEKLSVNLTVINIEPTNMKRSFSQTHSIINNESQNSEISESIASSKRTITQTDPNLTLISVFSSNAPPNVHIQRSSSTSSNTSKSSQLFSLFRIPKHVNNNSTPSNISSLEPINGPTIDTSSNITKPLSEGSKKTKQEKNNRILSFVRHLFCHLIPIRADATVTPITDHEPTVENQTTSLPPPPPPPPSPSASSTFVPVKEIEVPPKVTSLWKKVHKAVLPTQGKVSRILPSEDELLNQMMFSPVLVNDLINDLQCLNKRISLIRTFENLYEQSLAFHVFHSYVQHTNLIQYIHENKQIEQTSPDLNQYLNEFNSYNDLRICECPDHLMVVYVKLLEYHTNLYDMHEKLADDKREYILLKQFDRIMYYRIEICHLLLRCHCHQRLLVEIENGRKFLEKFQIDINNQDDFIYEYQYFIIKYTYNYFQTIVYQYSRTKHDSKELCEQNLKELNQIYQEKIWEKFISNTIESFDFKNDIERKQSYRQKGFSLTKDFSIDLTYTTQSSISSNSDSSILFDAKYRLEYLLCQYHLLKYNLYGGHQSIESINILINLEYYTFPLVFSLPCTIYLVEYFYCQSNYNQCLKLINKIIEFWWTYISPRERLEFAKLKCLSLIIELNNGSLDSAILSGYFAKRMLTGYHENVFLIESCIHLTLALIGEMRIVNIESILQHLEYLSEQTMNCYAKLWYYILVIDTAIELGYELLPMSTDVLDNITKYRKKLRSGSTEENLLLIYSDCILSQIYARLGLLNPSKIHFHQVLYQIKYDQMSLSSIDFRLKRILLKLVEIQLIHWYHTKEFEETITINHFLFNQLNINELDQWNKSRFYIYRAYYDRLVNDYRRQENYLIDNDLNWENNLREAEIHAIKLDFEWIKRLRNAWLHPVSEQYTFQGKPMTSIEHPRRSTLLTKPTNRRFIRLSIPQNKLPILNEITCEKTLTIDDYIHQKFLDWRLFLNNNSLSQFQLYILPVRV